MLTDVTDIVMHMIPKLTAQALYS